MLLFSVKKKYPPDSRKSQLVQRPTVSTGEHTNETEQSSQRHPKGSSGIFAMMIVLAVVVAAVWSGWEQAGLMDGSPTRTQDEFEKVGINKEGCGFVYLVTYFVLDVRKD